MHSVTRFTLALLILAIAVDAIALTFPECRHRLITTYTDGVHE